MYTEVLHNYESTTTENKKNYLQNFRVQYRSSKVSSLSAADAALVMCIRLSCAATKFTPLHWLHTIYYVLIPDNFS